MGIAKCGEMETNDRLVVFYKGDGIYWKGSFGVVKICMKKGIVHETTCKTIQFEEAAKAKNKWMERAWQEVHMQKKCFAHPLVVSVQEAFLETDAIYIIMEFCAYGNMHKLLELKPTSFLRTSPLD